MKLIPFLYQTQLVDFFCTTPAKSCICRLWLGAGKTTAGLLSVQRLLSEKKIKKTLVVAPKNVAKRGWVDEQKKWECFANLQLVYIDGTEAKRKKLLNEEADVYIINNDLIVWLSSLKEYKNTFDMLIIDESCNFKNSKTNRFRAIMKMNFTYKLLMSGTFASENLIDIWTQVTICDRGKRLGEKFAFLTKYFYSKQIYKGTLLRYTAYEISQEKKIKLFEDIKDICFIADKEKYTKLQTITYNNIYITPSKELLLVSKTLKKERIYRHTAEDIIVATTPISLLHKLIQVCNGNVITDANKAITVNTDKLVALKNLLADSEERFIIAYYYQKDRDELLKNIEGSVVYNEETHTQWNNKQIKYLLLHHSNSDGLNLQEGGSSIIWYSLPFSSRTYQQLNARVHRVGQKHPVTIHHLLIDIAIEEHIVNILRNKKVNEHQLILHLLQICCIV